MAEPREHDEEIAHKDVRYERTDVSLRGLLIFVLILIVSGIAIQGLLFVLLAAWAGPTLQERPGRALSSVEPGELPAEPVLEGLQPGTEAQRQAAIAAELNRYGWVDRKAGIARIPIQSAMDVLLSQQQKLLRSAQTPPRQEIPRGSNSGRLPQKGQP